MYMQLESILSKVDHTLLLQGATWNEVRQICDDAVKYHTASVCIAPSFVKKTAEYLDGKVPVCTVIGFPNGYQTTAVKLYETREALADGADEIDMVINIGWVREGRYDLVEDEIRKIKEVCGSHILKVIVEACLLTEEEKIQMCRVVTESGADYIKTSTGFSTAGATFEDVELFAGNIGGNVRIKAAGGIASLKDAEKFIELGASRLGTSRIIKILKESEGISRIK